MITKNIKKGTKNRFSKAKICQTEFAGKVFFLRSKWFKSRVDEISMRVNEDKIAFQNNQTNKQKKVNDEDINF